VERQLETAGHRLTGTGRGRVARRQPATGAQQNQQRQQAES